LCFLKSISTLLLLFVHLVPSCQSIHQLARHHQQRSLPSHFEPHSFQSDVNSLPKPLKMGPDHGVLGATFKATRALQMASMIAIIGVTSNFISEMVSAGAKPPSLLIAILSIVCIAVLYCAITLILYFDNILPFLISTGIDALFLIALVVVSVVVGKPLSYLNCQVLDEISNTSSSAYDFTSALGNSLNKSGIINYSQWIGTSKATCLEMKSIWGLSIALCILFTFSAVSTICLWKRTKPALANKSEA